MDKVYLFGGGNNAYGVICYLGKENIISIIDNEERKQGETLFGIPVITFDEYLCTERDELIIITTVMYDEIIQQLEENKIFNYTIAPTIIMGMADAGQIACELDLYSKTNIYMIGYNVVAVKLCEFLLDIDAEINLKVITDSMPEQQEAVKLKVQLSSYSEITEEDTVIVFKEFLNEEDKKYLKQLKKVYDVYELVPEKNKPYNINLRRFKDKHIGEKCFIVGNGPSLKIDDLEMIQKIQVPNFGFNLIYHLFDYTEWRPTYHVVAEYNIYRTYYDEIIKLRHDNMFIRNSYCTEGTPYIESVNYYTGYARRSYYKGQKFSSDISKRVYPGYSVLYDTIQIAAYMGFKEIYLVGVDFSYLNDPIDKGNHVYDNVMHERRSIAGRSYLDATLEALKVARKYAEDHEIKIYNATRGGKLEVFERKNLDTIFKQLEEK